MRRMKTSPITPMLDLPASAHEQSASSVSDKDLMCALQNGDATALEFLYHRYRDLFRAVIVRIVRDHAMAEDVLQDCLVEIWRSSRHFTATKGEPLAWLVTLCKRRAIDQVRRGKSYSNACERLEAEVRMHPQVIDEAHECENADMAQILREHLSQLPENQRVVVCLAFMEGMSQREVAKATHTPLGTVKTRLELGLRKLRTAFRTRSAMHSLQPA